MVPLNRAKIKFLVRTFWRKKLLKYRKSLVVKGLIMYQNFKKMPKIGQKCENGPILMTKTLRMAKIRIPSLLFNPFTTMCALSAQKRVQGRSSWHVPCGAAGAV